MRYGLLVLTFSALILAAPCSKQEDGLLVEEVLPQKKAANNIQNIASAMNVTLETASRTVEKLGLFQRNLVYLLTDTVTTGRKAILARQSKETRQELIEKVQRFCKQAETLINTINVNIQTFSSITSPIARSGPGKAAGNNG